MYEQRGVPKTFVALGSVLEAVLSIISGLIVYFISLPFVHQGPGNLAWLLGAIVIGGVLTSPPVLGLLYRWMGGTGQVPVNYGNLLIWLLMLMLGWAIGGLAAASLMSAFEPITLNKVMYIIGSWGLAGGLSSILVFLPGGAGVFEVSLAIMLSRLVPMSLAVFIVIVLRLLVILTELVWGMIALILTQTSY